MKTTLPISQGVRLKWDHKCRKCFEKKESLYKFTGYFQMEKAQKQVKHIKGVERYKIPILK